MLVRLQRFGPWQFAQQLLGLMDQNGQALRADVGRAVAMGQRQQRHFGYRPFAIDALGGLCFDRHVLFSLQQSGSHRTS